MNSACGIHTAVKAQPRQAIVSGWVMSFDHPQLRIQVLHPELLACMTAAVCCARPDCAGALRKIRGSTDGGAPAAGAVSGAVCCSPEVRLARRTSASYATTRQHLLLIDAAGQCAGSEAHAPIERILDAHAGLLWRKRRRPRCQLRVQPWQWLFCGRGWPWRTPACWATSCACCADPWLTGTPPSWCAAHADLCCLIQLLRMPCRVDPLHPAAWLCRAHACVSQPQLLLLLPAAVYALHGPDTMGLVLQEVHAEWVTMRARIALLEAHAHCTMLAAASSGINNDCCQAVQRAQAPFLRSIPCNTSCSAIACRQGLIMLMSP